MKSAVIYLILLVGVAFGDGPKLTGGPHFFHGSILYPGFPRPKGPIQGDEAAALARGEKRTEAYVVAYYSSGGLLESLEKYLGGKPTWKYVYHYEKNELMRLELTREGATKVVFDRDAEKRKAAQPPAPTPQKGHGSS